MFEMLIRLLLIKEPAKKPAAKPAVAKNGSKTAKQESSTDEDSSDDESDDDDDVSLSFLLVLHALNFILRPWQDRLTISCHWIHDKLPANKLIIWM